MPTFTIPNFSPRTRVAARESRQQYVSLFGLALAACLLSVPAGGAKSARADAPVLPPYGEVTRFPKEAGPDSEATYLQATPFTSTSPTIQASTSKLTPGKFVDPVGMAVDTEDSGAPNDYAIYVLDNTNPQEYNTYTDGSDTVPMPSEDRFEYRIQKFNERGEVLASTTFTLQSTAKEPELRATSLAVDGSGGHVYVLVMDTPPTVERVTNNAADRVDSWTTSNLTSNGELVSPQTLQRSTIVGDMDGVGIAMLGKGSTKDLALGGDEYGSSPPGEEPKRTPTILAFLTSGGDSGKLDSGLPKWQDAKATENAIAKEFAQPSKLFHTISSNPDGSLTVTLGGAAEDSRGPADFEPNMATVSANLGSTVPILPASNVQGELNSSGEQIEPNRDRQATHTLSETRGGGTGGATGESETLLGPSVINSSGDPGGSQAVYAGIVYNRLTEDSQNPAAEVPYTWRLQRTQTIEEVESVEIPASLGIRLFNSGGESLSMVGNASVGACSLQGGANQYLTGGSFIALVPGREGVFFALVQASLQNTDRSEGNPLKIEPHSPVGVGVADQVVEFAPGAGENGLSGEGCPQPKGEFSVANVTRNEAETTGSEPVTVETGTTLKFDASGVDLVGSTPWAYDWDLENGTQTGKIEHPWTVNDLFAAPRPNGELNETPWAWPTPVEEFKYENEGEFTATLHLVNDFGTLTSERKVDVVKGAAITGVDISVSPSPTVGQEVTFTPSATFPKYDSALEYSWSFGDGTPEEESSALEPNIKHLYTEAGKYTVKLTVTDRLGHTAEAPPTEIVVAPGTTKNEIPPPPGKEPTVTAATTPNITPPPPPPPGGGQAVTPPPSRTQLLAAALKKCKKLPKKKRPGCEKQAHTKYGPVKKKTHKHSKPKKR